MKICYDNLEKLVYRPDRSQWQDKKYKSHFYTYKEHCQICKKPFLYYQNGKHVSDYCDRSCFNKDRFFSEKTRNKIGKGKGMLGKKHSLDSKIKLSLAHKGKIVSGITRKKFSLIAQQRIGHKNPNWKGGISCEPYCEIWLDKEYKESIKERDGYQCLNPYCYKTNNVLCIHHIDYNKKHCHPMNLITLCNSCNIRANYDREWHKEWYRAIIYQRY